MEVKQLEREIMWAETLVERNRLILGLHQELTELRQAQLDNAEKPEVSD